MKNNRKGFTIVELVIVIAVIAILAAVLIPTFSNVINKANESAALQQATNAYKEAYALALSDDGKIDASDNPATADVGGFKFEWTDEGAKVTEVPDGFGYDVTVVGGKVVLGDPDNDDDQAAEPADLKVLSQNLRYRNDGDGNDVAERFPRFEELIKEYKPDLIGTQEGKSNWIDLLKTLDEYAIIGCSRAGENTDDEWNAILYKKERFDCNNSGTFWLKDEPDKAGTIIPDQTYNYRICTWAELYDKYTGETVIFANTHLDDTNDTYRARQAAYLLEHLKTYLGDKYNKYTIYLTGDFNCESGTDPYNAIIAGGFVDSEGAAVVNNSTVTKTFHGYGGEQDDDEKIDFCFYKGNDETVLEYEIISTLYKAEGDTKEGYVSDHYGVIATFQKFKAS